MEQDYNEEYENQTINEEYKIWKKNVPFLYDLVITHELTWPSLTVQWLPTKELTKGKDFAIHKLILGTHTSGQDPNYLMIAKVRLPTEDTKQDLMEYQQNNKDIGGLGFGTGENKIEIETKINHDGEVNRARYMPQKYNVIATKTVSGEVHVFDYTQHKSKPENDIVKPQLRLLGHSKEGYGLSWNEKKPGYLLSGANDNKICLWDIESPQQELGSSVQPLVTFDYHQNPVEDVSWHRFHENLFGAVSDDRIITLWDIRQNKSDPTHSITGHTGEIYSIDFNPFNEFLFLTGSADKTIGLWDLRNTSRKLHSFESHTDDVIRTEWSQFNLSVFASCSADRRLIVWDLSKIGEEQNAEDAVDGPPEILFIHGGHRAKVPDFSWNQNDKLVIASTEEENNFLQIWQMSMNIYAEDDVMEEEIMMNK